MTFFKNIKIKLLLPLLLFSITASFGITYTLEAQSKNCSDQFLQNLWSFIPEKIFSIGNKTYTRDDFIRFALTKYNSTMMTMLDQKKAKKLAPQLYKEMLEQEILLKCAENDGIKPSKELAEKSMDNRFAEMTEKEKFNLENFLKSKNTTFDEYKDKIASNKKNQTDAAINFWTKNFLYDNIKVTDEEVKKYYKTCAELVKVSHILIKPKSFSKKNIEIAKKKAVEIRKKISNGAKFEDFTSESGCELSTLREFGRGDMVREFEDAVFKLKIGEISPIVKTPFGFHIIKLLTKRKIPQPSFEKVKDDVKKELENLKRQDLLINAEQAMKEKENVQIFYKIED
jgi:parvulin-like peptidyl-prolyl isomerase